MLFANVLPSSPLRMLVATPMSPSVVAELVVVPVEVPVEVGIVQLASVNTAAMLQARNDVFFIIFELLDIKKLFINLSTSPEIRPR